MGSLSTVGPHGPLLQLFPGPHNPGGVGESCGFHTSDLGTSRDTYGGLQLDHVKPSLEDPLPAGLGSSSGPFMPPSPLLPSPGRPGKIHPGKPQVEVVFLHLLLSGNAWLPSE